jgi:hypothetical protein
MLGHERMATYITERGTGMCGSDDEVGRADMRRCQKYGACMHHLNFKLIVG